MLEICKIDNSFGEPLAIVESAGRLYLRHSDFDGDAPIIKGRVPSIVLSKGEEAWVRGVWKCWTERASQ